jgi:phosphoribosylaminoimidazole-succinocarboxamide synthase
MGVAIRETNFVLPDQVGGPRRGKDGDLYSIEHEIGDLVVLVRTDRIGVGHVIFPDVIPNKGQVHNQMSAELIGETRYAAPNWLLKSPDPNVSVGRKATPFPFAITMRWSLIGSAWKAYHEQGARDACGYILPDGMQEFEPFDTPLVIPTTKSATGQSEPICPEQIIASGLATEEEYEEIDDRSLDLFAQGRYRAQEMGLQLAAARYKFGRLATGKIVVIDEIHTPVAARYFDAQEYDAYLDGNRQLPPEQLSKDFAREWLDAQGFTGEPGQVPPHMSPQLIDQISARYRGLYERMLGHTFQPAYARSTPERLEKMRYNIVSCLGSLASNQRDSAPKD